MTAQAVADGIGGRLCGPGEVILRQVRSLETAGPDALSLCNGPRWAAMLAASHAGAVIVPEELQETPGPATRIVVADPATAMAAAVKLLHPDGALPPTIDDRAIVGNGTELGEGVTVGAYAILGDNVRIGNRVFIGPHVVVEHGVEIGDDVRLDAHVMVYEGSVIGNRVWCKANSVIGGAGYGFTSDATGHRRTPQVGGCVVEDDVEIGSGCCVDRGSIGDTIIGEGSKLDNLVHLGHNVRIGKHCLLMAGVGVAGSTRLGDRVVVAGQAGIAGHLTIGDGARIGAKAAVISNVPAGEDWWGIPARPHREFLKATAALYRLAPFHRVLEALARRKTDNG